jgi:hypothetical protein
MMNAWWVCGANGSCVMPSGGTPPYTYSWSNSEHGACIYNVPAGTYTVTVIDAAGCMATASNQVEELLPPVIQMVSVTNSTCGEANGNATAMTSGTNPLTHQWFGPNGFQANGSSVSGLQQGYYTLLVTDANGCTATENVYVDNVGQPITVNLSGTTCNPSQAGVFTQHLTRVAWPHCDSTVVTHVTLLPSDTTLINTTSCDSSEIGTFIEHFTNQYGCDSLVETMVTLLPSNNVYLNSTTCDPTEAGVFTQNLTNQFGCDSTVTTTVTLLSSYTDTITATICNGDFYWFGQFRTQAGVYSMTFNASNGCDSTIVLDLNVLPAPDTILSHHTTCDPALAGTFTEVIQGSIFCDSLVKITQVNFSPIPPTFVNATTCDPSQVGTTNVMLTTAGGCDSLVVTSTTLLLPATATVEQTTCDPALTGVFIDTLQSVTGCDSLIVTTFVSMADPIPPTFVNATTCDPSQVGTTNVMLTTAGGCDSLVVTSTTLDVFTFATSVDSVTCDGSDGSITISGGELDFFWSTGETTGTISGLTPGDYTVTVVNQNGCEEGATFTLLEPECDTIVPTTCEIKIVHPGLGDYVYITITPNPNNDFKNVECFIYNESGKLEFSQLVEVGVQNDVLVSSLQTGRMYFLSLEADINKKHQVLHDLVDGNLVPVVKKIVRQ